MPAKPTTVDQYLAALPPDRRAALSTVRKVIQDHIDPAYTEGVQYGMIGWAVPHSLYPAGYHCDPSQGLPFLAMASRKNHMSLSLMCIYGASEEEQRFREAWAKSGKKKLDMGKACVRFKSVDDLALDVIGATIRRVPARKYIAHYEAALAGMKSRKPSEAAKAKAQAKPKRRARG
jgi:hypothetical protein